MTRPRSKRLAFHLGLLVGLLLIGEVVLLATLHVFSLSGPLGTTSHTLRHEVQTVLRSPGLSDGERTAALTALFTAQLAEAETLDDLRSFTAPYRPDTRFPSLSLVLASLGVTLLLSGVLSRRIARPITAVARAAERVTRGDLAARVEVTPRLARRDDETALLAITFNQMAASLERLERERRDMIADIAHELRTPLSVLQGTLDALLDGVLPLEQGELVRLSRQTELLSRLVGDLRTLSLAEAARLRLDRRPTDVVALLGRLADDLRERARAKGVSVSVEPVPPARALLYVDPERLAEVVLNLLDNALRHTPEGGRIDLRVETTPEEVTLGVADSGPGIPEEALSHLFERFYRVGGERASTAGSGLGLAIARALVELHGGRLTAANRPEGGAVFRVGLPRRPPLADLHEVAAERYDALRSD